MTSIKKVSPKTSDYGSRHHQNLLHDSQEARQIGYKFIKQTGYGGPRLLQAKSVAIVIRISDD